MNWVDFLLILIVAISIWGSVQRGFILSALELCCWAGSLALAFLLYKPLANFIDNYVKSMGPWSSPLSFLIILIATRILLHNLADKLLERIPEKKHQHQSNKLLGIIPGLIYGLLWAMITATLLLLFPINNSFAENGRSSKLGSWIANQADWFTDKAAPVFTDLLQELPKENAAIGKSESITLPFKVKNPKRRQDLEAEMLILVNAERRKAGLKPLKADSAIAVPALKHSADMFARGYFSHITPEGRTPFQRMKAENVNFLAAGENLALAQTLTIAHRGLMNSPGHRANILHPAYGRLGIGILDGGIYGLMITQNFRN